LLIIKIEVLHVADVAVRGAELFSVKLPKASQHNFILSDDWFDLSRPCDQILEFASGCFSRQFAANANRRFQFKKRCELFVGVNAPGSKLATPSSRFRIWNSANKPGSQGCVAQRRDSSDQLWAGSSELAFCEQLTTKRCVIPATFAARGMRSSTKNLSVSSSVRRCLRTTGEIT
jgi:hypothetical protein